MGVELDFEGNDKTAHIVFKAVRKMLIMCVQYKTVMA